MGLRFYTTEQLGPTRFVTPEGFLLCKDVPIARVGTLLYAAGEIPIDPGPDQIIRVQRTPAEVFKDSAVNSFTGKPVTNDHPPEKVTPENWKSFSAGVVLDPRRGTGALDDCVVCDLLVQEQQAIQDVLDGKVEVSAGYDAEYEQLAPGQGKQYDIIGNHVALVDKGRCGPRCSIGDHAMPTPRPRASVADRLMQAFRTRDEGAFINVVKELGPGAELMPHVLSGFGGADIKSMNGAGGGPGAISVGEAEGTPEEELKKMTDNKSGTYLTFNIGSAGVTHAPGSPGFDDRLPPAPRGGFSGDDGMDMGSDYTGDDFDDMDTELPEHEEQDNEEFSDLVERIERLEHAIMILAEGLAKEGEDVSPELEGAIEDGDKTGGEDDGGAGPATGEHEGGEGEPASGEEPMAPKDEPAEGAVPEAGNKGEDEGDRKKPPMNDRRTVDRRGVTNDRGTTTRATVGDSTSMRQAFMETVSQAEILAPGIRLPTFDAKKQARVTFDTMCQLRKTALSTAWKDGDKRQIIQGVLGGGKADFAGMTCDAAKLVFNGAVGVIRTQNNSQTRFNGSVRQTNDHGGQLKSTADINAAQAAFWAKQSPLVTR